MSEYIGSRISLISKSDIKYIGTLHEINSDSHTVALEKVVSYGTEGRRGNPAEEIPGSETEYEYIVFRGSDVKQLEIVSAPQQGPENERPSVPDDPAILGSARPQPSIQQQPPPPPPHQQHNQFPRGPQPPYQTQQQFGGYQGPPPNQFQNQARFQGPGGPHGFPGTPGAVPGYGAPGYGPPPPMYNMGFSGPPPPGHGFPGPPPPGQFAPQQQMQSAPSMNQQRSQQQMQGRQRGPNGSQQGTPQPIGNQAPQPAPQPTQQSQPNRVEMPALAPSSRGPPLPVESKPSTADATAPSAATQPQQAQNAPKPTQRVNSRVALPLPSPNVLAAKPPQKPAAPPPKAAALPTTQPQPIQDATQAATAAVAAAMAKLGNNSKAPQQTDGAVDNLTQKVDQMRMQDGQQQYRGRGRGRGGGGGLRGARRESAQKIVDVPKEDYDFESANAKFNKQDLIKETTASGSPITSPMDGGSADPIAHAETNGHAGDAEIDDVVIPSKPSTTEKRYDKQSSFFDDISSDLKDRVEQQTGEQMVDGRAMRREERTKNMETFGQGSVDGGYRGGFRGRGRGRGGGRGYDRGYRGRGGFDGRGGFGEGRGRGRGMRGGAAEVQIL